MTNICGTGLRCDRHERALHGYPCHACAEEHWRRRPKTRDVLHDIAAGKGSTAAIKARLSAARKADAADRAAYDGPHQIKVEPAGEHGPVASLWNALCTAGCGWSHYWLPSKTAAETAGGEHLRQKTTP